MKMHLTHSNKNQAKGFTLVEMLVVLVIMATLVGIGANVMKNATSVQGTDTGVAIAEGVFSEARALAKANGKGARVVIFNGGADSAESREKHLRYMGVVRKDDNSDDWKDKLTATGVSLPSNVFFNANLSETPDTMTVQIPGLSGAQQCYYYEFNGEGFLVDPDSDTENEPRGKFIVQAGKLLPGDPQPRELGDDNRDVAGFAIWKRGNVTRYQTADQIDSGIPTF